MQALQSIPFLSVEDYLSGELRSEIRREYVGGATYAMAGASEEHNTIVANLVATLRPAVRGGPCRIYSTDLKVRLQIADEDFFYYPDLMVACDPRDTDRYFRRFPKLIIEVLSPETERTDRREKFLNYTQIETLEEYVLIAQERVEITVFRRANDWRPEIVRQPEESLKLNSINATVPLRTVYEDVRVWHFAPLPPRD
jgi:Uma2 family endonuclease